ncbi:MAG: AtpZ/AtpI family protein [Deferrisomatales bacterium]
MPSRRPPRLDPRELRDLSEHLGLVTHLGLTMVAAIGIGFALGYYLDRWTGGGGLWKALCIPLGALSGFWAVYRLVTDTGARSARRRR